MIRIRISIDGRVLDATLNDSATARAIADALPLEAPASVWGDEIYFGVPVTLAEETHATAEVEVGVLAYWPPGNAFCIFFGPTPASHDLTPRAYSLVNLFGRVDGDATTLRAVKRGARVRVDELTAGHA